MMIDSSFPQIVKDFCEFKLLGLLFNFKKAPLSLAKLDIDRIVSQLEGVCKLNKDLLENLAPS
jgi:hypothetical protein